MDNKFGTGKILEAVAKMKRDLPVLLANQAQRFFTNSFKQQGFDDSGVTAWQEVKRRQKDEPEYKYPKTKGLSRRTTPILVRTGKLRRAVSNSIRNATFESVKLVTAIPYASYNNEGTDHIPKRMFMGDSRNLRVKQIDLIEKNIDKAFKP